MLARFSEAATKWARILEDVAGSSTPLTRTTTMSEGVAGAPPRASACSRCAPAAGTRGRSAFYLPGEIFAFEPGAAHRFAAEAIADSRIAMVRRAQIEDAALRDPGVGRAMWDLAAQDLERLQEHMLLLGRRSAAQRVAAFLIELSERLCNRDTVDVPMSRTDIADYLGLTIETVSRTLTQFERDGLIEMPSARHILIKNRAALERLDA